VAASFAGEGAPTTDEGQSAPKSYIIFDGRHVGIRSIYLTPLSVSRLVDRIAWIKYIRTVHSPFVVDMALSIAILFAVSVLLIFDDTFPLSYLPPRSLSFGFIYPLTLFLASFWRREECMLWTRSNETTDSPSVVAQGFHQALRWVEKKEKKSQKEELKNLFVAQ